MTVANGLWSVVVAPALPLGIEAWQYLAGAGYAQATDVACNTLGASVGVIPLALSRTISKV